ncbi:UNVERIFIED_CONTAM: hypothetical protein Slati_2923700 [Sesamum latifolium]|uniref:Uncharacterized protein n=1 Tax=Sesamum latifolium TaxID=2727402 RepID=A0AAW2VD64_9LAMI
MLVEAPRLDLAVVEAGRLDHPLAEVDRLDQAKLVEADHLGQPRRRSPLVMPPLLTRDDYLYDFPTYRDLSQTDT